MKKILTEQQKIDKFLIWLKDCQDNMRNVASGGSSSWNWGQVEAVEKIYRKSKIIFK